MQYIEKITSLANPKIKDLVALQVKSDLRRSRGVFVVEGLREVTRCLIGGYRVTSLFYCPEIIDSKEILLLKNVGRVASKRNFVRYDQDCNSSDGVQSADKGLSRTGIFEVSRAVYEKAAYRGSTEGVIAVVEIGDTLTLEALQLPHDPLIIAIESVEKPGNIGAILRTADAVGVDAVLICDPRADLYNPNLIRSSLGAAFTLPVVACSSEEAIDWMQKSGIRILTAQLQDSELYYDTDMTCATALVFGTEADGLTDIWRRASGGKIRIPMNGVVDSLNVSVSVAVLCYEALRQRSAK